MERTVAAGPCLDAEALRALVAQRAPAELLRRATEHLIGTPREAGCASCKELLAERFLDAGAEDDPEVNAARALKRGRLKRPPGLLTEILNSEAATSEELGEWERWAETRRPHPDPRRIASVIIASYVLRFDPGASGLLSYGRLAATMADTAGDPWSQAFAHAWLSRVRGIRGELREAAREIDAALKAADRLDGMEHRTARAYALHQSADLRLRLRDFAQARDRFDRAIELYKRLEPPRPDQAQIGLAIMFTEAGQWEEARAVLREVFTASQDELVVSGGLLTLTAEVLPNLAREGVCGCAEQALCFYAAVWKSSPTNEALGRRARGFWMRGRIAWALGVPEVANSHLEEARSLFLSLAPDVAGMYEAACITLDMMGAFLQAGSLRELQAYALEAAKIFSALGADTSALVALGLVRQLETRAGGAGIHALAHARIALHLTEKRRLLRSIGEGGVI